MVFPEQLRQFFKVIRVYKDTEEKSVYRVRHLETGADFVCKGLKGNPEIFRKMIQIKCQYLPEIFEVILEDDYFWVIEEYISGDLASEMLKCNCFSAKETRKIAMDICKALYVLHSQDIVHRDVKPENIILRGSDAVLLDLDASRVVKDGETVCRDTDILGTTGYAAPEQYGLSQTDGRADIYALGVTMNIMLTGEHPSVQLAQGRLGRVISNCIKVNQGKRYKDIRSVMEALA